MKKIIDKFKRGMAFLLVVMLIFPIAMFTALYSGDTIKVSAADTTPPTITSVETQDLDGDGQIDALMITFDENVKDSTVTVSNFNVIGYSGESFSSTTNGDVADNDIIYIEFTESGTADSDVTPNLDYTKGTLTDIAIVGNFLASISGVSSDDKAAPAMILAETKTNNRIDITFSENLIAISVQPEDFAVDSNTVTSVDKTNNPVIELSLGTAISGGNVPQVSIPASRNVNDMNSNKLNGPVNAPTTQDGLASQVVNVSSILPNGSYPTGSVVDVAVQFDESVIVNTSSGSPTLQLETGVIDRLANYVSGSGSDILVFNYSVQSNDNASDLGYKAQNSLLLNSATIKDGSNNNADLTLPMPGSANSLSWNKNIVIDTSLPAVPSITVTSSDRILNVEFWGVGGGIISYQIFVNGILSRTIVVSQVNDSGIKYSREIQVGVYGLYQVYVQATNANGTTSSAITYMTINRPVQLVSVSATPTVITPESVSAEEPESLDVSQVTEPEDKPDEKIEEEGQIKGEEESDEEEEKINWTPWIILFILIILAGAATGGYFYWFGEENEIETQIKEPKAPKKSDQKKKKSAPKKSQRW